MSKQAFGNISGVPWSTVPEAAFTLIVENMTKTPQGDVKTLENEDGAPVLHLRDGAYVEVTFDATIKGATHFGTDALIDTVITSLSDPDIPVPLIVTGNSHSKAKREWQKCTLTARYYGAGFTTGTVVANIGTTTTGA
jgi:hypothetical protein